MVHKLHPTIKNITFTPTGDTAKALNNIRFKKRIEDIRAHLSNAAEDGIEDGAAHAGIALGLLRDLCADIKDARS